MDRIHTDADTHTHTDTDTETHNPWTTHTTEIGYENPWIRVEHSEVTTPGGSPGIYGVVRFKNRAVGIVPVDAEDHTWLVGQYRYTVDEYSWEMPAGGSPEGESLIDTAHRELIEETGYRAGTLDPLFANVTLSNSVTDERGWCWLATDLTEVGAAPEECEDLQLRRLPVDEAIAMVFDGTITDGFTVMAYLHLAARRRS